MKLQTILSILTTYFEIAFFGGEILGFPFLQFVLEKEGYFYDLCDNSNGKATQWSNLTTLNSTNFLKLACKEQEASFNLVFTLAISCFYLLSFFSGYILDKFGTWIHRIISIVLKTLSFVLIITSTPLTSYLLYPAAIFSSSSGMSLMLSNFQIANFSKSFRNTLITLMEGTFDSSVIVFFLIKIGYDYGINFQLVLLILLSLTIFLWLRTFLLMPRKSVPYPLPEESFEYGWKETKFCNKQAELPVDTQSTFPQLGLKEENLNQIITSTDFKDHLKNSLFWTNVLFYSLNALRLSFFTSSLLFWLKTLAFDQVSDLSNVFGIILLFGFLISSLNGLIIDATKKLLKTRESNPKVVVLKSSLLSLCMTNCFCLIFSVMTVIPSIYGSFILFFLSRGFIHGGNTAFIASNFPCKYFGKLYGLTSVITGAINFFQYAIFQITLTYSFYYVNIGLLVMVLLTNVHLLAIYIKIRSINV